jgi:hypothetical protein
MDQGTVQSVSKAANRDDRRARRMPAKAAPVKA